MLQRTDILRSSINSAIQTEFSRIFQDLAIEHPLVSWAFSHPIWTILLLLVLLSFIVFIIQNLVKSINYLMNTIWVAVLGSPFKLSHYLFNFVKTKASQKKLRDRAIVPVLDSTEQELELSEIMQRLESLNQEQDRLLKQVAKILNTDRGASS